MAMETYFLIFDGYLMAIKSFKFLLAIKYFFLSTLTIKTIFPRV